MRGSVQNLIRRNISATYGGNPVQIVFIVIALIFVFLVITFGPQLFDFIQERRKHRQVLLTNRDEEKNIAQLKQDRIREQDLARKFEASAGLVAGLRGNGARDRGGVCLMLDTTQAKLFKELNLSGAKSGVGNVGEVKTPQKVRFKR